MTKLAGEKVRIRMWIGEGDRYADGMGVEQDVLEAHAVWGRRMPSLIAFADHEAA